MMSCYRFFIVPVVVLTLSPATVADEHLVHAGDTIAKIARFYGVSQNSLMQKNNIDSPAALQVGDVLIIPERLIGNARRKHVVQQGDTLISIAKKHRVDREEIRTLNRLGPRARLSVGQVIAIPNRDGDPGPRPPAGAPGSSEASKRPELGWSGGVKGLVRSGKPVDGGVRHTVLPGQSVAMIARAYNLDPKKLAQRNQITKRSPLTPGREILIPGARRAVPVRTAAYRPHKVSFIRIKNTKRMKLALINRSGTLNQQSRRALTQLLGYRRVHPRLLLLLQQVAERFPGHAFEIISGYRKPERRRRGKKLSPHARGVAVDFRLQGVANELLYEFISSFDNVGAGYYPNSIHVHLDVRDKKYLWTDVSGRGEPALYVNPGETEHWDTVKETLDDGGGDDTDTETETETTD